MRTKILVTSEADGGFAPFSHGELEATFHFWSQSGAPPLLDGMAWAFVDWVLPNISGLEVCRRLRCDPLTAQARITIVLESDDIDSRKQALRAGADDYLLGPLRRAANNRLPVLADGRAILAERSDCTFVDPAAQINLGTAMARLGQRDAARDHYRVALSSRDRYDLELADGRWMDSRAAARLAIARLAKNQALALR